jgi:ribonuclease BN (tRNA processing enzyme)
MLTILGGGGWFPAHGRQTACAVLRRGDRAIMIDAGTGVGRIVERPELLGGVQRLDIVLTHFHLDHIAGLAYLPALGVCQHTTVWGPGQILYDTPTHAVLDAVSHEPLHPVPLEEQDIGVRDLPHVEFELAGIPIIIRRQDRHSAPSLGIRFGDELAWVTDTAYDPESVRFAAGCEILAHEAWCTSTSVRNPDIHASAAQAADVAARAGSQRLVLIHLPPFERSVEALVREAQAAFPPTLAADDGSDVAGL